MQSRGNMALEYGPADICRMDSDLIDALAGRSSTRLLTAALLTTVVGGLLYGFAFGLWRSPLQGFYSAIKMPLLFLSVTACTTLVNTMLAQIMGATLTLRQVCTAMLLGTATMAAILGALSPVAVFFVMQLPSPPSTVGPVSRDFTPVYGTLMIAHVAVIGIAGLAGNIRLYQLLKSLTSAAMSRKLLTIWLIITGFAGCQLSWLFSPFLCKPDLPAHFLPQEYFCENFYERIFRLLME